MRYSDAYSSSNYSELERSSHVQRRHRTSSPARHNSALHESSHSAANLVASKFSLPHSPPRNAHLRNIGMRLGESYASAMTPDDVSFVSGDTYTVEEKNEREKVAK